MVTLDITNAFVQTPIPESNEKTIMRISVHLAELIIELLPQHYEKYRIREGNTKIIYVQMLKALYGMMMSSLLFYRYFRKDLESIGFVVNPYNICVANRNIEGTQQTITWHVDDMKVSHKSAKVNKEFCEWCKKKYGSKLNRRNRKNT